MANIAALLQSYHHPWYDERGRYTSFCPLCGGPFYDPFRHPDLPHWLSEAKAMTTVHTTTSGTTELDRYQRWGHPFPGPYVQHEGYVLGSWRPVRAASPPELIVFECEPEAPAKFTVSVPQGTVEVVVMWVEEDEELWEYWERRVYGQCQLFVPLHSACFDTAQTFVAHHRPLKPSAKLELVHGTYMPDGDQPIESLIGLYATILARGDLRDYGPFGEAGQPVYQQTEPHNYFLERQLRTYDWIDNKDHIEMLHADPMAPTDTSQVLSSLSLLPESLPSLSTARSNNLRLCYQSSFLGLPLELRQHIESYVFPCMEELPIRNSSIFRQEYWRDNLASGRIFPWLWDLDPEIVKRKENDKPAGRTWDWELLVRKLSQTRILGLKDDSLSIPWSLRNRRRIWRLLEVARVGDLFKEEWDKVISKKEIPASGPVYVPIENHWGVGHEDCGPIVPWDELEEYTEAVLCHKPRVPLWRGPKPTDQHD